MQIVLNEALSASAQLTPGQFDALSLILLLRYTRQLDLQSPDALREYINRLWEPFAASASRGRPSFQHLQYTGCGSAGGVGAPIEESLASRYPWLFSRGFTREAAVIAVSDEEALQTLLIESFHDARKWQLQPVMKEAFGRLAMTVGVSNTDTLWDLQGTAVMQPREVRAFVEGLHPAAKQVFSFWHDTPAKSTSLTSVGVAIAHANVRRKTGERFDLSYWIN